MTHARPVGSRLGSPTATPRNPPPRAGWTTALAAGRIALGLYWLWEQHWKLPPEFGIHDPRGLMFSFQSSIESPTIGLYRSFLQYVVVPHFYVFGWLIFVTETVIGLSLTFGLLTRMGALLGTLQSINLLVAQGATAEGPWLYLGLTAANLAALLTPSNHRLSLDRRLAPKVASSTSLVARVVRWMVGL